MGVGTTRQTRLGSNPNPYVPPGTSTSTVVSSSVALSRSVARSKEGCCARTSAHILVFGLLGLKVLPQLAPATICFLDAAVNTALFAIFSPYPPGTKIQKSYENYTFSTSLLDVVVVAIARGSALFVAYLVCNLAHHFYKNKTNKECKWNCCSKTTGGASSRGNNAMAYYGGGYYEGEGGGKDALGGASSMRSGGGGGGGGGPGVRSSTLYLWFTSLIALASLVFLGFKASLYNYTVDKRTYADFSGFGPMVMVLNVGFVVVHVATAKTFDLLSNRRKRLQLRGRWSLSGGNYYGTYDEGQPLLRSNGSGKSSLLESLVDGSRFSNSYSDLESPRFNGDSQEAFRFNAPTREADVESPPPTPTQVMEARDMAQENSQFCRLTENLVIHYQEFLGGGSGGGGGGDPMEAIVILHGFYGNVNSWKSIASRLAKGAGGKRVIVFDRIGFGLSSRPPVWGYQDREALYGMESHAEAAVGLCQKIGIGKVHLVAHDDAAKIVLLFASRLHRMREEASRRKGKTAGTDGEGGSVIPRITSVALLHPNTGKDVVSKLMEHLLSSNIKTQARKHLVRMEVEVALRRQCYRSSAISPGRMELYKKPLHIKNWEKALRYNVQSMKEEEEDILEEHLHSLSSYRVLLATGAHDSIVRPDTIKPIFSGLPSTELYIFDDCGHLCHEECPEDLVNLLVTFISNSPSSG